MMIYNFHGKKMKKKQVIKALKQVLVVTLRKFCENQRKRDKGKTQSHVTLALLDVRELLD
jgi:hypothetical protein